MEYELRRDKRRINRTGRQTADRIGICYGYKQKKDAVEQDKGTNDGDRQVKVVEKNRETNRSEV